MAAVRLRIILANRPAPFDKYHLLCKCNLDIELGSPCLTSDSMARRAG